MFRAQAVSSRHMTSRRMGAMPALVAVTLTLTITLQTLALTVILDFTSTAAINAQSPHHDRRPNPITASW